MGAAGSDLSLLRHQDAASTRPAIFSASADVLYFDYLRIPYSVALQPPAWLPCASLSWIAAGDRGLCWPAATTMAPRQRGLFGMGDVSISAALTPDTASPLQRQASGWEPLLAVTGAAGETIATILRREDGVIYLPFDPGDVIRSFWSERYLDASPGRSGQAKRIAMHGYYAVRPLIPRRVQLFARRRYSVVQGRAEFPRWPIEPSLHDFYDWIGHLLTEIAGTPVPYIAPWPRGRRWALVLTHDVETDAGRDRIGDLRAVEEGLGLRSAWYFVPRRYTTPRGLIDDLTDAGFEVGVHGLYHDGRDLSPKVLPQREDEMRLYRDRWQARGFRSPALIRHAAGIERLGFDYDTSYPDTDPYQPQAGGCCTWLPFFNGRVVELPVTLAQDHTLFEILGERDERRWVEKATFLRVRSGAAILITHPDYMTPPRLQAYGRFLERFSDDESAWHALPAEVSAWWRRRATSWIEGAPGDWRVAGPAAAEATVAFTS